MAEPRELTEYQTDHDLLVGLARDVSHLTNDVGKLNEAVSKKNDDHEQRIRTNERNITDMQSSAKTWRLIYTSALSLIGVVVSVIGLLMALN